MSLSSAALRTVALDATRFEAVDAFVSETAAAHGPITGLVNCAGSLLLKPAHLTSQAEYEATIAAARTGLANHEAIAAKAGVIGLTPTG